MFGRECQAALSVLAKWRASARFEVPRLFTHGAALAAGSTITQRTQRQHFGSP